MITADPQLITDDILNNLGGINQTSLCNIVNSDDPIDEEPQLLQHSPYLDHEMLINILSQKTDILNA